MIFDVAETYLLQLLAHIESELSETFALTIPRGSTLPLQAQSFETPLQKILRAHRRSVVRQHSNCPNARNNNQAMRSNGKMIIFRCAHAHLVSVAGRISLSELNRRG